MLPQLVLSLQFASPENYALHRSALPRHRVARWVRHALAVDGEITVRIVNLDEGRGLNREFRHKDYATNVLTFDYAKEPSVLADLVLCAPVVEREALEQGKMCCMPKGGTMKPQKKTRMRWNPAKLPYWQNLDSQIPIFKP
ncbi:MAG: hypothetical protein RLZZ454_1675 [Pseudomonadota bacterium]